MLDSKALDKLQALTKVIDNLATAPKEIEIKWETLEVGCDSNENAKFVVVPTLKILL